MREAYVLFADIRGHSCWAENHSADELAEMLNDFYALPKNHYFYENYCSDEIVLFFKNAEDAIDSALVIQNGSRDFVKKYGLKLSVAVIFGEVSKTKTSNGTVLYAGHTICIANRMTNICQPGKVMVAGNVREKLNAKYQSRFPLKEIVQLKGKKTELVVYSN